MPRYKKHQKENKETFGYKDKWKLEEKCLQSSFSKGLNVVQIFNHKLRNDPLIWFTDKFKSAVNC